LRVVANVPRQLPSPSAVAPVRVRTALHRLCLAGASGALRILGPPGGTVFLIDGRITHAECPLANGLADLLTAGDRVAPEAWSAAVAVGGADHRVGDVLVERGAVTGAELEVLARTALFAGALFQLPVEAPTHFDAGVRHPVGPVRAIEFDQLCAEVDRRRATLVEAWPDDAIDTAPIRPVRHLPGHHVALTSTQWAIIASADRVLSPIELALTLGHDTFAVLLEARRMARAGLIEPTSERAPASEAEASPADASVKPGKDARPLPRRRGVVARPLTRHRHDDPAVPVATLLRIRRGLEERL
jgi:hypothetical protein